MTIQMTKEEYRKIHRDYKGKLDGKRTVLRNINGSTCLVFVELI